MYTHKHIHTPARQWYRQCYQGSPWAELLSCTPTPVPMWDSSHTSVEWHTCHRGHCTTWQWSWQELYRYKDLTPLSPGCRATNIIMPSILHHRCTCSKQSDCLAVCTDTHDLKSGAIQLCDASKYMIKVVHTHTHTSLSTIVRAELNPLPVWWWLGSSEVVQEKGEQFGSSIDLTGHGEDVRLKGVPRYTKHLNQA